MSSRLSYEISKLVGMARFEGIHDHDTIKELTMVVGLAYLVELHPQCSSQLHKHLQTFLELACTREHAELCEHASKIIEMFDGSDRTEAA
jgi:hypothetical protein